jgi:hypothetical protein
MAESKKKKINYSSAWAEAKRIIWNARWRLAFGSLLMLISRLAEWCSLRRRNISAMKYSPSKTTPS